MNSLEVVGLSQDGDAELVELVADHFPVVRVNFDVGVDVYGAPGVVNDCRRCALGAGQRRFRGVSFGRPGSGAGRGKVHRHSSCGRTIPSGLGRWLRGGRWPLPYKLRERYIVRDTRATAESNDRAKVYAKPQVRRLKQCSGSPGLGNGYVTT